MKKQPLAITVSIILFIIVTATFAVLGYMRYSTTAQRLEADLQRAGQNTLERLQYSLAEPVWDFDTAWAKEILNTEMLNRTVYAIVVRKPDNAIIAAVQRDNAWGVSETQSAINNTEDQLLFTNELTRGKESVGQVELFMTTRFMDEELGNMLTYNIISTLIADLVIILALFLALRLIIIRPVKVVQNYATRVGAGELECVFPPEELYGELDRLKEALYQMVCKLKENIETAREHETEARNLAAAAEEARNAAEKAREQAVASRAEGMIHAANTLQGIVGRVSQSSHQLEALVMNVSRGSELQRSRINETATSMNEMTTAVTEVAQNASEASHQASLTRDSAATGNRVVASSVDAANQVSTKVQSLKDNMQRLGAKADEIGHVISVINDIADQTNLLALNAAIEAARAGEAGRGFAVVADEVRKLAEKTMAATKEVGDSITAIQQEAHKSMTITEDVDDSVTESTARSSEVQETLDEIQAYAATSSDQIAIIATAAEEQSSTTEHINRSIEEINRIAEDTAEGMDQATTSIAELGEQTAELNRLVEELQNS